MYNFRKIILDGIDIMHALLKSINYKDSNKLTEALTES